MRTLGIDLGPNSMGWAIIESTNGDKRLLASGVRVFADGLDDLKTDVRGKSRNVQRRLARAARRQTERRARRLRKTANALQRMGLLPEGDLRDSVTRHETLKAFDATTMRSPYQLRALALDESLPPHELGRALYHLSQRRGYLSNRKAAPKKIDDEGVVQASISELQEQMAATGSRTIGELFAKMEREGQKIRKKYTWRRMLESEFDSICATQRQFHPEILTDDSIASLREVIFYQRPLKSQKGLIGRCQLEPERRRAPWALLTAQRVRYLQKVNDLRVIDKTTGEIRELTRDERDTLVAALELQKTMTFGGVRKLLKIKNAIFNLEEGGEKAIPGNETASSLAQLFGVDRWKGFSEEEQERIVDDLRSTVSDETLKRRGIRAWKLPVEDAEGLTKLHLKEGYCQFSRQALKRLLPKLREGIPLQTVIRDVYPEKWERGILPVDELPPVRESGLPEMRNPIVERSLTEVRTVLNSLLPRFGKPDEIRLEMARELRQSAKQREEAWKKMRAGQKEREKAAARLAKECGIENPSRDDILKVLLAEECDWTCPYTGKRIPSLDALVGAHPQFDLEHIIPFSRCLDDSYMNLTLCEAHENRNIKSNRTPWEAYGSTPKWTEITGRVRRFKGTAAREKARRFVMTPEQVSKFTSDFTARQLNDTRYASKWAKRYLGLLYGGIDQDGIDSAGRRRVQATSGPATAFLRRLWGLNGVLGTDSTKSRDDHRHHIIDAIVTALTDQGHVKALSDAAVRGAQRKRKFDDMPQPWESFLPDVKHGIENAVASHKITKRVRGALHKETFYGSPFQGTDKKHYAFARIGIEDLSDDDIANIPDRAIRRVISSHLQKHGGDRKKAFGSEDNLPYRLSPDGKRIVIRKVRLPISLQTFPVGEGHRVRHVQSDSNHHMEVFEILDDAGKVVKWGAQVVSMLEAYRRVKDKTPVICRDHGPRTRFLFSLAKGEVIELDTDSGTRAHFVVRSVPMEKQIRFVPINDARTLKDIGKKGYTAPPESLRKRKCRKVLVTPLGEVRRAND